MGASGKINLSLLEAAANTLKSHSWESTHVTVLTQHVGQVAEIADESVRRKCCTTWKNRHALDLIKHVFRNSQNSHFKYDQSL